MKRCSVDSEGSVRTNTGIIYNALSNNKFRESFSSFEAFYIWPVNYSDKCLDIDLLPCWKKVNTIHFFTLRCFRQFSRILAQFNFNIIHIQFTGMWKPFSPEIFTRLLPLILWLTFPFTEIFWGNTFKKLNWK